MLPGSGITVELTISSTEPPFREYNTKSGGKGLTIQTNDYIIIACKIDGRRETVAVSYLCWEQFRTGLQDSKKFLEEAFEYDITNNAYKIADKPICKGGYKIENLCRNGALLFKPVIDKDMEAGTETPGVDIYFADDFATFVAWNDYIAFTEFFANFNLYMAAKTLMQLSMTYEAHYGK
jgi:hypothetical protein